jgi:hypothetical protein
MAVDNQHERDSVAMVFIPGVAPTEPRPEVVLRQFYLAVIQLIASARCCRRSSPSSSLSKPTAATGKQLVSENGEKLS